MKHQHGRTPQDKSSLIIALIQKQGGAHQGASPQNYYNSPLKGRTGRDKVRACAVNLFHIKIVLEKRRERTVKVCGNKGLVEEPPTRSPLKKY